MWTCIWTAKWEWWGVGEETVKADCGSVEARQLQGVDTITATPVKYNASEYSSSQSGCAIPPSNYQQTLNITSFMAAGFVSRPLYWIASHCTGVFQILNQQPKPVILTDVNMSGMFRKNTICQDVMPPVSPKINKLHKQKKTHMATASENTQQLFLLLAESNACSLNCYKKKRKTVNI